MSRCLVAITLAVSAAAVSTGSNKAPIIAIFSHPSRNEDPACGGACDYTAASYPKWVESAGGRAVPVPYDASDEHVEALFRQTNGLLWPGGGASLSPSAKRFFDLAVDANANHGDHYPVWGTCLGFEWLLEATANSSTVLQKGFDAENITLPLNLTTIGAQGSRMLGSDAALLSMLQSEPVTMNNHVAGIQPDALAANPTLASFFDVLSTNDDRQGRPFVSTIEGKTQPIYGTQWHPEKNIFEWGENADGSPYEVINHSADAVSVSQKLVNFFVAEARKNDHKFDTPEAEQAALYYNYSPHKSGPSFVQEYYFHWPMNWLSDSKTCVPADGSCLAEQCCAGLTCIDCGGWKRKVCR